MSIAWIGVALSEELKKRRFLREGVLDEMIDQLQEWDRDSLKESTSMPTLASLIHMFETSKLVLQHVESQIEDIRDEHPEHAQRLKYIAYVLQTGLKSSFVGIEDEKVNITN